MSPTAPIGSMIGDYRIVSVLSQSSGFSTLFHGIHSEMNKIIVIKQFSESLEWLI